MNKPLVQAIYMNQLGEIFLSVSSPPYDYTTLWLSENIKRQVTCYDYFEKGTLISKLLFNMNITYVCDL